MQQQNMPGSAQPVGDPVKDKKEKARIAARRYASLHPDRIRERNYRNYHDHQSENQARARGYYEEHRAEILQSRKDHRTEYRERLRDWRARNPEKVYAQSQRRKARHPEEWEARLAGLAAYARQHNAVFQSRRSARVRSLPATLTPEQWKAIKKVYRYRCAYCGKRKILTQDHVIPLSKGGGTVVENIVPACRECNSGKHNRLIPNPPSIRLML